MDNFPLFSLQETIINELFFNAIKDDNSKLVHELLNEFSFDTEAFLTEHRTKDKQTALYGLYTGVSNFVKEVPFYFLIRAVTFRCTAYLGGFSHGHASESSEIEFHFLALVEGILPLHKSWD